VLLCGLLCWLHSGFTMSAHVQHNLQAAPLALTDAVLSKGFEGPGHAGGRVEHTVHEP
jgi:hypothetical protein